VAGHGDDHPVRSGVGATLGGASLLPALRRSMSPLRRTYHARVSTHADTRHDSQQADTRHPIRATTRSKPIRATRAPQQAASRGAYRHACLRARGCVCGVYQKLHACGSASRGTRLAFGRVSRDGRADACQGKDTPPAAGGGFDFAYRDSARQHRETGCLRVEGVVVPRDFRPLGTT